MFLHRDSSTLALLIVLLAAVATPVAALDSAESEVSIDELRPPTAPAFTILGVAPTNVERPNTPRAFAASVLSSTERSSGDLPSDLAVEFTPFWWSDHPELTFDKYYNEQKVGRTILQTLAISLATTKIPVEGVDGTSVGIGTRFLLVAGKATPELAEKVNRLKELQTVFLVECVPDIDEDEPADGEDEPDDDEPRCRIRDGELVPVNDAARQMIEDMRQATQAVKNADRQRLGWVVEAALAASADIPEDRSRDRDLNRYGVWATASYRVRDPDRLTFVVVGRYTQDDRLDTEEDMFDLGGRILWRAMKLPLTVSAEVVERLRDGADDSSVIGSLEYEVNDTFSFVASYGKGLELVDDGPDTVATAGLRFGFGKGASIPAGVGGDSE